MVRLLFGSGMLDGVAKNKVLLSVNVAMSGIYTFAVNIALLLLFAAICHHAIAPIMMITAVEIAPIINFVRRDIRDAVFFLFAEFECCE